MQNFEQSLLGKTKIHERTAFEYSPENPPSLELLEAKVFAVHATSILPKNGILKASVRDRLPGLVQWHDEEPPTFRPTIHFALGELVQSHSRASWEGELYAVVSPIKLLKDQLVNIFAYDTFILGDLQLRAGMILLVPEGTDTSQVPQEFEVREYRRETGLRETVDATISTLHGWHIQMESKKAATGSVAYIDGVEINSPEFFRYLFQKYPHVSFGDHTHSERGDAFRFGVVGTMLNRVMENYSQSRANLVCSTVEIVFHRSLILHHLQKLEQTIKSPPMAVDALRAFEEKKRKVFDWLHIVDCDLKIREELGKTLTGASESIQEMAREKRAHPEELMQFLVERQSELADAVQEGQLSPGIVAEALCSIDGEELKQFTKDNGDIFRHLNLPEFFSHYAVSRWILIRNERAQAESLDHLLEDSLAQLPKGGEAHRELFRDLEQSLSDGSNRLDVALSLLRNPAVKKWLEKEMNIHFPEGSPANLRDVIAAHPETKILLEPQEFPPSGEQEEAYRLLNEIGQIHKTEVDVSIALRSFENAERAAFEVQWAKEDLQRKIEMISQPMNYQSDAQSFMVGAWVHLYERLRKGEAIEIWGKVGLETEYRDTFPNDSDFWNSDHSLVEIYRMLKAQSKS